MKSLNKKSPNYYKEIISKRFNISKDNIILFGSRIRGDYSKTSDLDIALIYKDKRKLITAKVIINKLLIELHFVKDFKNSQFIVFK